MRSTPCQSNIYKTGAYLCRATFCSPLLGQTNGLDHIYQTRLESQLGSNRLFSTYTETMLYNVGPQQGNTKRPNLLYSACWLFKFTIDNLTQVRSLNIYGYKLSLTFIHAMKNGQKLGKFCPKLERNFTVFTKCFISPSLYVLTNCVPFHFLNEQTLLLCMNITVT